jgi:phosphohistidine phosphatase SixA
MAHPSEERHLILIRHGHRDKFLDESDNGLSEKGVRQAKRLADYFGEEFKDEKSLILLTSPRVRCRETLEPLSRKLDRPITVNPWLEEGGALAPKVRGFLKEWAQRPERITLACSHGDWIPALVEQECGSRIICRKSSFVDLVEVAGEFWIHRVLQRA